MTAALTTAEQIAVDYLLAISNIDMASLIELMDEQIAMSFPFAPEGFPPTTQGKDECLAALETILFAQISSFQWHDLQTYPARDKDLVFVTARSEVQLRSGTHYVNNYCLMIRLREGRVTEHTEFFNPLNVIKAFN